jgi:hypothetical protein
MAYNLTQLRVTYNSKLRWDLQATIKNLKNSIEANPKISLPLPQRVGRSAWRVWYLKAPFRNKLRKKHFVFFEYKYAFTWNFNDPKKQVTSPQATISTALGSMAGDTLGVFDAEYANTSDSAVLNELREGNKNFFKNNELWLKERQGQWRQQYSHWNYKQYVNRELR